jgi:hypothetical protein
LVTTPGFVQPEANPSLSTSYPVEEEWQRKKKRKSFPGLDVPGSKSRKTKNKVKSPKSSCVVQIGGKSDPLVIVIIIIK